MSTYVGGKRLACIQDSFYRMVSDSMGDLGWLTSNPGTRQDVTILAEQINSGTEIRPNKIGISSEDMTGANWEMGSNLSEDRWDIFIDIFAENEFVGVALAGDIRDILRGKIGEIDRLHANFPVYDYEDDSIMFYCQLENIEINRIRDWDRPYNKYWWVVACQIVDYYYDDNIENNDIEIDGGNATGIFDGDIDGGVA
jgi:hypothetical protein